MDWAKVQRGKKPFAWWYHKILCEVGWNLYGSTSHMYYKHLHKCCDLGYNLYGEAIEGKVKKRG